VSDLPWADAPLDCLLLLVLAHFVCDFTLQGDRMAEQKNPRYRGRRHLPWQYWLLSHAATHGLAVGLLTGVAWLGVLETALHGGIDWVRCRRGISLRTDQVLHMLCKVAWVAVLVLL
jgi:hypothetical protein